MNIEEILFEYNKYLSYSENPYDAGVRR